MNASHLHIILITLIIISLSFELYYMSQAQDAKNAIVNQLSTTASNVSSLITGLGTDIKNLL